MASNQQCKTFIAQIAPIIQKVAKERGYLICSTVIAQACVEDAYGTSILGKNYHNYFGMKCGSAWKGKSVNLSTKEEYTVGTLTSIKDNFRVYDSMEDGVKGYYDFINTKRYANLKTANTAQLYAERLKADGYATSSTYVNTLINTVKKWNLEEWDNFDKQPNIVVDTSPVIPKYFLGETYKTNVNLFVRVAPEGNKVLISLMTKDGKRHSYDDGNGYAILRKGTRVTCLGVNELSNGDIWIKIPSGYIAAYYKGKVYVE